MGDPAERGAAAGGPSDAAGVEPDRGTASDDLEVRRRTVDIATEAVTEAEVGAGAEIGVGVGIANAAEAGIGAVAEIAGAAEAGIGVGAGVGTDNAAVVREAPR